MSFFDIGLEELLLIFIIALIVIGPKQLPELARKLGAFVRTVQKASKDIRIEVSKELEVIDQLDKGEFPDQLSESDKEIKESRADKNHT